MLGRAVTDAARAAGYQTWGSGREHNIADHAAMRMLEQTIHPHYVVNCAGVVPEHFDGPIGAIRTNALGPWVLRSAFTASKIVHISTDCVYDGKSRTPYNANQRSNAEDWYGRTKAMGEASGNVNVRCSFVGLRHGLLAWLLKQPVGGNIDGWSSALWNGGTVLDVADALVTWGFSAFPGIHHLASDDTISKATLLAQLSEVFNHPVRIHPQYEPKINRALQPTQPLVRDLVRLANTYVPAHAS